MFSIHNEVKMKIKLKPLDELFSRIIRNRAIANVGGCERCWAWKADYKQLQCAHMFTRKYHSVRWDEENAVGVCAGCHFFLDSHPQEKIDFFKQRLGEEKFDLLQARANTKGIDKELIKLYLQNRIKEREK